MQTSQKFTDRKKTRDDDFLQNVQHVSTKQVCSHTAPAAV